MSSLLGSADDPFGFLEAASLAREEEDLFAAAALAGDAASSSAASARHAKSRSSSSFAARRKKSSLFDEEEEETGATESTTAAPSAALASPLDEELLSRVLAAFSPSEASSAVASAARVNEDEFDRVWMPASAARSGGGGGLFSDSVLPASRRSSSGVSARTAVEDKTYAVFKLLESGARGEPRRIRLTAKELQTLAEDGSVSRAFEYADLFCVTCAEPSAHSVAATAAASASPVEPLLPTVSLSFIDDEDRSYASADARELVADLNDRLAMSKRADMDATSRGGGGSGEGADHGLFDGVESFQRARFASAARSEQHAARFQEKLAAGAGRDEVSSGMDASVFFSPSYIMSGSRARRTSSSVKVPAAAKVDAKDSPLARNAVAPVPTTPTATLAAAVAAFSAAAAAPSPASTAGAAVSPVPASSPVAPADPVRDAAYQAWQRKYALDQAVQERIDALWLAPSSEEFAARTKFIKAFPAMEKGSQAPALLAATRRFLDSFSRYMEKKRAAALKAVCVGPPKLLTEAEFDSTLHARVERSTEVAVLLPIWPRMLAAVQAVPGVAEGDIKFAAQVALLRGRSQAAFGIPEKYRSPSNWQHAQNELQQLQRFDLPADKLEVLLGTAKAIYTTYQHESKQRADAASAATAADSTTPAAPARMAADDFFPVLTFVVAHTPLQQACALKQICWDLCDPSALNGESGYYLTVFDAAVEYIKRCDTTGEVIGMAGAPAKKK